MQRKLIKISKRKKSLITSLKVQTIFPLYTASLMNLSNSTGNLTSKKNIGPLHEYFHEFQNQTRENKSIKFNVEGWKKFYLKLKDGQPLLDRAIKRNLENIKKFKEALQLIDKQLITQYIYDLVFKKTFIGLNNEYLATFFLAKHLKMDVNKIKKANTKEETKGIDMWIDKIPLQIKPYGTYLSDSSKTIKCKLVVYYEIRNDDEFTIYFDKDVVDEYIY